jgi:hypothetical protein
LAANASGFNPLDLIASLVALSRNGAGGNTGGARRVRARPPRRQPLPHRRGHERRPRHARRNPVSDPRRETAAGRRRPVPGLHEPRRHPRPREEDRARAASADHRRVPLPAGAGAGARASTGCGRAGARERAREHRPGIAPQVQQNYQSGRGRDRRLRERLRHRPPERRPDPDGREQRDARQGLARHRRSRQTAPNLTDVLFGTMGKLPADTLQAQGAAFKSAADMLPATALGQGSQQAADALNQGYLSGQSLQHQLDAFLKQGPAFTASALTDLQKQQMGLYDRDQTARYRGAQLTEADRRLQVDAAAKGAQLKQGQQRIQLDAAKAKLRLHAEARRRVGSARLPAGPAHDRRLQRSCPGAGGATNEKIANAALGLKAPTRRSSRRRRRSG